MADVLATGFVSELSLEWQKLLQEEFGTSYFKELEQFVTSAYITETVFPARRDLFKAFSTCQPEEVKVVILGQDPYHGVGQAHGLSFSVPTGIKTPPSLRNIFKEISAEFDVLVYPDGNLERWASQGVFLLNSVLTVEEGKAASHKGRGWERFTDAVIRKLSDQYEGIVFMLWGNSAKEKCKALDETKHLVLTAVHPSPLGRGGFFGCNHFVDANLYLKSLGKEEIDWR